MTENKRIEILGCPIDVLRLDDAVEKVEEYVAKGGLHQAIGVNLDQFQKMHNSQEFKKMVVNADLITADGHPIVWASWVLGSPLPARVTGIDLFEALLQVSAVKGYKIFLLGASEHSIQAASVAYLKRYPGLKIVGTRKGYFTETEEGDVVEEINRSEADMLFIAITSPKKEVFVENNRDNLHVKFVLGVGGAFDIAAKLTRRAPKCLQYMGMEWAWRLIQEPRRMWPRVRSNSVFSLVIFKESLKRRMSNS